MKIILSAHFDLNKPVKYIRLDNKKMYGLVDNFAGVFAAYEASRKTGVELYLTNFEEVNLAGAIKVAKDIKKQEDIIVIVVDTCLDAKDKKAYIGNAYYLDTQPLKEKFKEDILFKDGFYEPTEDETAAYGWDLKIPCLFFGIPITGGYHITNNEVKLTTIDEATKTLIEVITWIQKNEKKIVDFSKKRASIDPTK